MSHSLPLAQADGAAPDTAADIAAASELALTGTVAVFDPAMCCPTGLCGPGVDPALLAISRDLRWLEKHGATVTRAGLSTDPQAFVTNARVQGLLQAFGDGALPATLVNGEVLVHGRYATRDEIVAALQMKPATIRAPLVMLPLAEGGSCEPGSGCC
jgi:hypothetical protein